MTRTLASLLSPFLLWARPFGAAPVEATLARADGDVLAIDARLPPDGDGACEPPAVRTSLTHPIEVDWLPVAGAAVGLTFAPGKRAPSFDGPPWARDLDMDLVRLREHHGVDAIVCLVSDPELAALQVPDYVARVVHHGFALHRLPIRDGDVPSSLAAVRRLLADVVPRVRRGERVVVHCRGGLGRAGTVAGCLLVELGLSSADALRALEVRDPHRCPETEAQRELIRRYASSMRRRAGS